MARVIRLLPLIVCAIFAGVSGAAAQAAGPDESVQPNGAVTQSPALTPAQANAVYNVVMRQDLKPSAAGISLAIGWSVPPSLVLPPLPEQASDEYQAASVLKYAMVESDIVVVDPIKMRVVDIIHDRNP